MSGKLMNFTTLWRLILTAGSILLLAGTGLPAIGASENGSSPEIRDMVVVEKQGRLLAFVSLRAAFSPKVFEALQSGVTTRFTFEIALMRHRVLIYDTEVDRQTLVHMIKYDTLKKAYTFTSQNGSDEKIEKVTKSRKEMMNWMADINGHEIAQVGDLNPNERYYIQVRAKLNSVDFSFPFNYMLSFLASKTPWAASPLFDAKGM